MIIYPAEWNARKEAVFSALVQAEGGGLRLWTIPMSLRGYPETEARVALCLSRAKNQPRSLARWLKAWLIRMQYNGARKMFARNPTAVAVVWNGLGGSRQAFLLAARDAGLATLACELAPFPDRITLDPAGVNAEGLAAIVDVSTFDAGEGWRAMGQGLTARPSRRADVGQAEGAPQGNFLFCPLQVPNDSQVTLFSDWCVDMQGFLSALAHAAPQLPPGWHLRVKEHPSARRPLDLAGLTATCRVVVDNDTDSFAQLAGAQGVVTLNSSMGLQAFFHDKPVLALGRAFWAREDLVSIAADQASLDAAFANPDSLGFDAGARARFMNWLDQRYYPRFKFPPGEADLSAFAEKLRQARKFAANAASGLSPQDLLR